jgi:wee1-like protein kinase
MVNENPSLRPSASTLVHHPCICPDANKSKAQLRKELNQEKFKNEMLQRKVRKYEEQMNNNSRLIGDSPGISQFLTSNEKMTTSVTSNENKPQTSKFVRSLSSSIIL